MLHLKTRSLIFVVLLQLVFFSSFGQSGSIRFELQQPAIFKKVGDKVRVHIQISGKLRDSTSFFRDTVVNGRVNSLDLKNIPRGMYQVDIFESYTRQRGKRQSLHDLGWKTILSVVVDTGITKIKERILKDCPYYKDITSDVCPVCHRNASVIPICKGFTPIDPYNPDSNERCYESRKYSGCSPPVCAPFWYCEKDKLEF